MALSAALAALDPAQAAARLAGVTRRTPLERFHSGDARVELRVKLECQQVTGAFKARGAWNQVSQLSAAQREAGVVTVSSGNHGKALAWAAGRAGVRATIVMPADAYPNKIAACRDEGAEVLLGRDRPHAEALCRERVEAGATLVHPYDAERTIQGAGTVGLEIAAQWPEVEAVLFPVGGGGLIAGSSLALRRALGERVRVLGVEPQGARTLGLALEAGAPVTLERITTSVQGLCPLSLGRLNLEVCRETVAGAIALDDATILAAQRELVRTGGWTVEPAGAAAVAAVLAGRLPADLLEGRGPSSPLRVVAVVSGGNPDPAQLEAIGSGR
jgi:threonine dehydratase